MKSLLRKFSIFKIVTTLLLMMTYSTNAYGQTAKQNESKQAIDQLLNSGSYLKKEVVKDLPTGDVLDSVVPTILDWSLRFSWVAVLAVVAYSALQMVVARGEEENLTKAKNNLVYAILALVVISGALAIVTGIVSFKF